MDTLALRHIQAGDRFCPRALPQGRVLSLRPLGPPLFDELFCTPDRLPGPARGGVLNLIAAVLPLLAPLGRIPQLGAQAVRAVLQAPAGQLLGGGCDALF